MINRALGILAPATALAACAVPALAWEAGPILADEVPRQLQGVGIEEHLDQPIPLELTFRDETGSTVELAQFFQPKRPVILTLNYFRCPMLCTETLNGMVMALNDVDWSAGDDFEIVTVSINPKEGPELAAVKKRAYLTTYDRPSAAAGWHFLTGEQRNIERLAEATGFGYRYDPATGEYAHSASIMFLTPDGRLSRYMNDVRFKPKDVRLALVEASKGAIGSTIEKFLLFTCYRYDPAAGSYAPSAIKIMRFAGAVTVFAIVAGIIMLRLRGSFAEHAAHRRATATAQNGGLQS